MRDIAKQNKDRAAENKVTLESVVERVMRLRLADGRIESSEESNNNKKTVSRQSAHGYYIKNKKVRKIVYLS